MSGFQIVLVRPDGYLHIEALREVAETLQYGLRRLGHVAEIKENVLDAASVNVILGGHLLSPADAAMVPSGSILYNLEQLGGASLPPAYYELASRLQVWDYSRHNIDKWKTMICAFEPVHVELGYVPELRRIAQLPPEKRDIDVLFYGSINERRRRVLDKLRDSGVRVEAAFGVYGRKRDRLIARSKLVLNVHFYDAKLFELVRISYLLANSKAVVTEDSSDGALQAGLADALVSCPYDALVDACLRLLHNQEERQALETRGFERFSQRDECEILKAALEQVGRPMAPARNLPYPNKLNLGSGKDWREDYFNVDCNAYWEPDAVLDFNHPLPLGEPLETQRFGTVTLENDSFQEIIANDCLEHISSLTAAMTSCLNLLAVGGLFRINVPYDLSWGAWQDPTHVRAFNERSWLYYTDWFWYLGWTEARFDVVEFELGLSPVGEELKRQGISNEELIRHPRAVDRLGVALKKRLLTENEKQQVAAYLKRPKRNAANACAVGSRVQTA